MVWYQIIPDRWSNGNIKNDATSWPLDWNGIISAQYHSGHTLHDSWLLS
jgi:hypothetical protein